MQRSELTRCRQVRKERRSEGRQRQQLLLAVTQYSGVGRGVVKSVLAHLEARTQTLNLTVHRDKTREYMTRLTALLTALAMNYLYTDKFFEVD